jgi:hypothetical protein
MVSSGLAIFTEAYRNLIGMTGNRFFRKNKFWNPTDIPAEVMEWGVIFLFPGQSLY